MINTYSNGIRLLWAILCLNSQNMRHAYPVRCRSYAINYDPRVLWLAVITGLKSDYYLLGRHTIVVVIY